MYNASEVASNTHAFSSLRCGSNKVFVINTRANNTNENNNQWQIFMIWDKENLEKLYII